MFVIHDGSNLIHYAIGTVMMIMLIHSVDFIIKKLHIYMDWNNNWIKIRTKLYAL